MRHTIKYLLNRFSQLLALPAAILCRLEKLADRHSEIVFAFFAHSYALLPGVPGVFLRRGFYSLTLDECSVNCHIGFGTIFTHREAVVEENAYLGNFCMIGSARLGKGCLLGSRVSVLSGKAQHIRKDDGTWEAFSSGRMQQVHIAPNVWIGEGAIVMADIGEGSLVAAGSVVTSAVKGNVVVGGNPARFIRTFETE